MIPENLVKEVTINMEVKVCRGQMREGYSTSYDAESNFDLKSHIIAELRKELKNKMTLKTASIHLRRDAKIQKANKFAFEKSKNMLITSTEQQENNRNKGSRKYCR